MFRKKSEMQPLPPDSPPRPPFPSSTSDLSESNSGNPNLLGMFSTNRRRFNEKIGQMMGKESTADGDFEEKRIATHQLHLKITKVRDSMKATLEATRLLSQRSVDLSNVCNEADARDDIFVKTQLKLDESMRSSLDLSIGAALDSLDKKVAAFKELDEKVRERNNLKLDYDHYVRKVKEIKDKPGIDPAKIANNESKLEAARILLHNATLIVYQSFNYYSAVGGKLVAPEIETFKTAQHNHFKGAFECVNSLKLRDPQEVSEEMDRIGEDGSNRPIVTGYEGTYADSTRGSMDRSPSYAAPLPYGQSSKTFTTAEPDGPAPSAPWGKSALTTTKSAWWEQPPSEAPTAVGSPVKTEKARALYDYKAADGTEISFKVNDVIEVVKKDDAGWWVGKIGGYQGMFPSNYVKLL